MLLERDFVESEFYEEEMDEITDYGLKRWVCYVLSLMGKEWQIEHKIVDPFDVYVDSRSQKKGKVRAVAFTFTKTIQEMKEDYKTDYIWTAIDWDKAKQDIEKSLSEEKNKIISLKEPKNKDVFLLREWWYIDTGDDGKKMLVKVLTTRLHILKYEE